MRTLAVAAITSLIALTVASVASAAPTVSLVWTGTSGSGTAGSSTIASAVGDTLTLDILITTDSAGASVSSVSYEISTSGTVHGGGIWPGVDSINSFNGFTVWTGITGSATYGGPGLQYVGGSGVTCPYPATGNASVAGKGACALGTLTVATTGTDQGNGTIGAFSTNVGGFAAVYTYTQARASFEVVPEPATGGLLALGLGALVFIGRRRA